MAPNLDESAPMHNNNRVEEDDETSTLVTAAELLNNAKDQVSFHRTTGFDDDATVVAGNGNGINGFSHTSSTTKPASSVVQAHVHQLKYNYMKVALDRAISTVVELLQDLKAENSVRPIYYPTNITSSGSKLNSAKSRLALIRKNSLNDSLLLSQADLALDQPTLTVFDLNLKIDQLQDGSNYIANLDKESIASLLDQKFLSLIRHLLSLKERIDDTTSKVFVTGDLNAGKSAFCNALLRKKILPEDEQPCTNVFCEVIDATENNKIEEVHAVPIGSIYNQNNQSSFHIFQLKDLDNLVYESDKYSILKIYVNDSRPTEQSLLKNNVIDISLIDAPGLNMDSYQTTEVFSRQEEIDLVVFVVDARNHFTLSGKEFISALANEKNLLFIVVNKFDTVKNKDKCKSRILDQVLNLSPDTHKDSKDFVHFVSSDGILSELPDGPGDGGDDDPSDDDNDYDNPDFDHLESSLRKFILEKRALSKLLPAKNYTINVLKDLEYVFQVNETMYLKDRELLMDELNSITPVYEQTLQQSLKIQEKINKFIEKSCSDVYDYSKNRINMTLQEIDDISLVVSPQSFDIYAYAISLQQAMIDRIVDSVTVCENYARKYTSEKVNVIKQIGIEQLGSDFYNSRVFRDDLMFTKKRDSIQKRLQDDISLLDFFDPSLENMFKLFGWNNSVFHSLFATISDPSFLKIGKGAKLQIWKGSASAVACVSSVKAVNQLFPVSLLVSPHFIIVRVAKPVVILSALAAAAYLILDMPSAFQRNTARKIKRQINDLDYQHKNSNRIAKEVRTVLNYPLREVFNCFQTNIDKSANKRDKIVSSLKNSDLSSAFYSKLLRSVINQRKLVENLEIESLNHVE